MNDEALKALDYMVNFCRSKGYVPSDKFEWAANTIRLALIEKGSHVLVPREPSPDIIAAALDIYSHNNNFHEMWRLIIKTTEGEENAKSSD